MKTYGIRYNGKLIGCETADSKAAAIAKAVARNPHHEARKFAAEARGQRVTAAKLFGNPKGWMK